MTQDRDDTVELQARVAEALEKKQPIRIHGGETKRFLGVAGNAIALDASGHRGILSYEPTELVITARSGTTLNELRQTLTEKSQMLAFEPPGFGPTATIGGTLACALSGPARPFVGAVRDFALGCRVINGQAQQLRFGGEVMKNVAGYDVTRLMTGAMGTLGLLLDVSVKVLPSPECEITLVKSMKVDMALQEMQQLAGSALPISAACFYAGQLYTRLSGTELGVADAAQELSGETLPDNTFWHALREHELDFFNDSALSKIPLWRLSVPSRTTEIPIQGQWLYDWAGMQRWLFTEADAELIRNTVQSVGGHATLFHASDQYKQSTGVFHPLSPAVEKLHRNLKAKFDPHGLFNPQRLYGNF